MNTALILLARQAEFLPFLSRRQGFKNNSRKEINFFQLPLGDFHLRILAVGSRPESIHRRVDSLPADWLRKPVLFLGTAGALTDELKTYSLFLADEIVSAKDGSRLAINNRSVINRSLLQQLAPDFSTNSSLLTSSKPLLDRSSRLQAGQQYQSQAVDLEAVHIYKALRNHQDDLSFTCLKIISDGLDDSQYATVLEQQKPALEKLWDIILSNPDLFQLNK